MNKGQLIEAVQKNWEKTQPKLLQKLPLMQSLIPLPKR